MRGPVPCNPQNHRFGGPEQGNNMIIEYHLKPSQGDISLLKWFRCTFGHAVPLLELGQHGRTPMEGLIRVGREGTLQEHLLHFRFDFTTGDYMQNWCQGVTRGGRGAQPFSFRRGVSFVPSCQQLIVVHVCEHLLLVSSHMKTALSALPEL